ncbi:MAG: septal ring lytic transglycosylase RlpA family protein [Bacteroidota bacterium]
MDTKLFKTTLVTLFTLVFLLPLSAQRMEGMATIYANKFDGKKTSTGEVFRQSLFTAASKELAWGTIVEVTNLDNGKKTQVRINDCGPHTKNRLIDLSLAAGRALDFVKQGEIKVRLRILRSSASGPTCSRGAWAKQLKKQGLPVPPPPPAWNPAETAALSASPGTNGQAPSPPAGLVEGLASFYPDRLHGRKTSTGETYDRNSFTAASKIYPYGTVLEVTNVVSGVAVNVRVNDCGPMADNRILDLSYAAAARIDLLRAGVATVRLKVIQMGDQGPTCNRTAWANAQASETAISSQASPPPPTVPVTYGGAVGTPVPADAGTEGMVEAYSVQVGAFGSQANAFNLSKELFDKGYPEVGSETGPQLTRVFTGNFATRAEAKQLEARLRKAGYKKATVKAVMVPAAAPTQASSTPLAPTPAPPQQQFDPSDILFGVQVGAFSSKSNADNAATELRTKGFQNVYSATVGKVTRVFCGKFYFQHQAEEEKAKLREAGYGKATVRRVQ